MTVDEMKQLIETEVPFDSLKLNASVVEFYAADKLSIGISYETDDEGKECYIYNLFCGDEYINIAGAASKEEKVNADVLHELVDAWNWYIDITLQKSRPIGKDTGSLEVRIQDAKRVKQEKQNDAGKVSDFGNLER